MQIVTDSGMDMYLPPELMPKMDIHIVRHVIVLDGVGYRSGLDVQAEELQKKMMATDGFPSTSQPSPDEFADMYRKLAQTDPDILSIHMSSGLSGTYNSAKLGAQLVPEAHVTVVDTKTLCAVMGWQVAAAARAAEANWPKEDIVRLVKRIGEASESMFTIDDLKYLIHGGRISHMRALIASIMRIRPLIGVDQTNGTYVQLGIARTFDQGMYSLVEQMKKYHAPGAALRVQVLHACNPEAAEKLKSIIDPAFKCDWMPIHYMSPVLAAHTGPDMVGVAFAPQNLFKGLP